jgi:hypothetical protein
MAAFRSSSIDTRKMNLQPILNKNLPWAHIKLELDVLGVAKNLVKYLFHLSKKDIEKNYFIFCKLS